MFLRNHAKEAGAILGLTGFLGLSVNLFILHRVIYGKVFGKSFGRIWISRGIGYACISFMFTFYVPLVQFTDASFVETFPGQLVVQLMAFFCLSHINSNFLIALNRYVIVSRPLEYKYLYCDTKTALMIVASWIIAAAGVLPSVFRSHTDPCNKNIFTSNSSFFILPTECYDLVNISHILIVTVPIALTIVVDLVAMYNLRNLLLIRKTLTQSYRLVEKRSREMRLCCMILVQACFSIYIYISFSVGSLIKNEFLAFLASTVTWELVHSVGFRSLSQ